MVSLVDTNINHYHHQLSSSAELCFIQLSVSLFPSNNWQQPNHRKMIDLYADKFRFPLALSLNLPDIFVRHLLIPPLPLPSLLLVL